MEFQSVNSSSWALNLTGFTFGNYSLDKTQLKNAKILFDPSLPFIYMPHRFFENFCS
jgi:hypothetical protein